MSIFKCYQQKSLRTTFTQLLSYRNRYRLALLIALKGSKQTARSQERAKPEKKESQSISGKLMSDLRNVTNSPANGEQINLIKCHFFHRTPVFRTQTSTQ